MLKFEDTKLMKHPTVERAYKVMRTFFEDGDDWAKQAIRAGEIISEHAKNPDPDAIAASILMNGMIVPLDAEQFETSVSPKAAQYLKKFYDLDLDKPKFKNAGEEQVLLAQSIVGLEGVQDYISSGKVQHIIEYRTTSQIIGANEDVLTAIARKSQEKELLAAAQAKLAAAQQALADVVDARLKEITFESSGLPDHPVIRATYEEMKAWALDGDPLGGYTLTNAAIARVLVETGATNDPEVISAALLNQYSNIRPGHKKPSELSERIGELYEQTSPWADLKGRRGDTTPKDPEAQAIVNAARVFHAETEIRFYSGYKADAANFDEGTAAAHLETLEEVRDKLATAALSETHDGLKARMEKAVNEADAIMHAPENTKIRKPVAPAPGNG